MDKENVLKVINSYINAVISSQIPVVKVYLFGSTVKGLTNENSDIDVALFLSMMKDELQVFNQLMRIRRDYDLRIEPHPFLEEEIDNGNPFINNIVKTGVRVF